MRRGTRKTRVRIWANWYQTRIPASVAAGYRKMGINIDDPQVARRMLDNRQKAVSKGWLPEQVGRNLNIKS